MNLLSVIMQAGTISKNLGRAAVQAHARGQLDDILTSGWFWGIVIFCGICVIIYNLVKDN